jgi:predicted short-subunit dehydrogenase-like oxidoreductase (DUF2520 family)
MVTVIPAVDPANIEYWVVGTTISGIITSGYKRAKFIVVHCSWVMLRDLKSWTVNGT